VSVGIDELAHRGVGDWFSCGGDEQETTLLPKNVAGDRLDANRGPIEVELHLATAGQADPIPEGAPAGIGRQFSPDLERPAGVDVPLVERAIGAPERERIGGPFPCAA
jgi:hypothetical protein